MTKLEAADGMLNDKQDGRLPLAAEVASIMTETAVSCYWEWDVADRSLRLIPDGLSLFGKNADTMEEFFALLHPDDVFMFEKKAERFFVTDPFFTGEPEGVEFRVQSPQGRWKWFVMRRSRVGGPSEKIAKVVGSMMDIDAFKRSVDALRSSKTRSDAIFESAPGSMAVTDTAGRLERANQAFYDMLGYSAWELRGVPIMSLSDAAHKQHEEDSAVMARFMAECKQSEETHFRREDVFVRSNGERIIVNYGLSAIYDFDGNIVNYIFSGTDITLQVKHAEELDLISRQLQQLHSLIHSLLLTQRRDQLLDGMLGYLKSIIPNSACAVYSCGTDPGGEMNVERLAWYDEEWFTVPDDDLVRKSASSGTPLVEYSEAGLESRRVSPLLFQSRVIGVVDVCKSIGMTPQELKMYQLLIDYVSSFWVLYDLIAAREKEASVDALTGIWNRRYMLRRFQEEADRIARYGGNACVVLADMGNFKQINDNYGHSKGDEVLVKVARTLRQSLRASDSVGRYGGDEFLLLLPNVSQPEAELVTERIKAELAILNIKASDEADDGTVLEVILDFGIAAFPGGAPTLIDTINLADEEMFAAKVDRKKRAGIPITREEAEKRGAGQK